MLQWLLIVSLLVMNSIIRIKEILSFTIIKALQAAELHIKELKTSKYTDTNLQRL